VQQACAHLGVNVEVRNQARVHLWYQGKFGGAYSPLLKVTDGIDRYLIRSTCLGVDVCTGTLYRKIVRKKQLAQIGARLATDRMHSRIQHIQVDRW